MIAPAATHPVAPVHDDGEQPRADEETRQLQHVDGERPHASIDGRAYAWIQRLDGTSTGAARILTPP